MNRPRAETAALGWGAALLSLVLGLASALTTLPPPRHVALVVAGLVLLAFCGTVLLSRRFRRTAALISGTVTVIATVAFLSGHNRGSAWPATPLNIRTDARQCLLEVAGEFSPDLYARLDDALHAAPRTRALLLHSAGGTALGLTQVAQLLRQRGVDTAVAYGQCDSACAFLWVSAPNRYVVGGPREFTIGFHAPHLTIPWLGDVRAALQDRQQRAYLRAASALPENFIGWAYAPVENLWRPDLAQLDRLGVKAKLLPVAALQASFCGGMPELPRHLRIPRSGT